MPFASRGNGAVTRDTFDAASRLASLTHDPADAGFDATFGYTYNPASQLTSRSRSNAAYDWVLPSGYSESGFGPDRISRTICDLAGRVSQAQSAVGTALVQTTAAYTYTNNGLVATLTDAHGFRDAPW